MNDHSRLQLINLASELTVAWLSNTNNRASVTEVADVLLAMANGLHRVIQGNDSAQIAGATAKYEGAISVRRSLASPDRIISMIDGKPYSALKRHLSKNGLTPEQYRQRYNLNADYPMVAPGYSERRRIIARETGLGQRPNKA